MAKKGQKFRKYSEEFKEEVVIEKLPYQTIAKMYSIDKTRE
ncbi:hypothetical protein [Marinitoga sp. 38H-ov]|nr:hypothetical protein [Marinitoga sp. 38H-ov]